MTTELCGEDVLVRLSSPQIISTETIVAASPSNAVATVVPGGVGRVQASGVELGRRLLLAARAGDTAAVLDLMAKGAPFTTDWLGTSPLHLAAANNHVETCAVLLRAGVSRDSRTKVERTPLHLAAHAGHARVVSLLLDHGAMVDCRDMLRMTPLHWAAARGHVAAARELLRRGADARARCKFRKTPRCLAARTHRTDVLALLDEARGTEEIKTQAKVRIQPEKTIIIESKTEPVPPSMSSATPSESSTNAADSAGAAALLRAHGITLLPADRGCTVLTALRSGRTVVLSDAGKLMLKESSNTTTEPQIVVNNTIASSNTDNSAMDISSANTNTNSANIATVNTNNANISAVTTNSVNNSSVGIVSANSAGIKALRTVRPGKNVKVLTLNKPQQPLKKIIHPSDLQQVKVVQVAGAGGAKSRPALKLLLNKVNLQRLLSSSVTQPVTQELPAETSMEVDELSTSVSEEASLREQLAAARTTIASMAAELRACRAKLAMYEKDQPR